MTVKDKVVLITGAKGVLGTYVTTAFLESGARVFGVSRSIKDSDFERPDFTAIAAELSSLKQAKSVADTVIGAAQRIDIFVHLMGGFAGGQLAQDTDDATIDRMLDMNFRSAFHMIRAVLPSMARQKSGRILAIGSKAAVEPAPMAGAYAASKAALVSLIRTVARENGEHGITANIVLPGTMDTPANRSMDPKADYSKWVNPDQVAQLLLHLASDTAGQISGAVIPVYGREA